MALKITIDELKKSRPAISLLRLLSFDPEVYLVELEIEGATLLVTDSEGNALRFRSQLAAKKPFKGLGIEKTLLQHDSSYDEMIGHDVSAGNRLEVGIASPDNDYS